MPRASREQRARNHDRVAEMVAAGLTPGGFAEHVGSGDELVASADTVASAEWTAGLEDVDAQAPDRAVARTARMGAYLSTVHRHLGEGCPTAALAADVGGPRAPSSACRGYPGGVDDMLATLRDPGDADGDDPSIEPPTPMGAVRRPIMKTCPLRSLVHRPAYGVPVEQPAGRSLFSPVPGRARCSSRGMRPRIARLKPGRAEVTMRNRGSVRNHLGTVHAFAWWTSIVVMTMRVSPRVGTS